MSYGSILAIHAAAQRKVTNLVLLSSFVQSTRNIFKWISDRTLVSAIPPFIKDLSKRKYGPINDRKESKNHIMYHKMPVKPLKSVLDSVKHAMPLLPEIHCPALLIHSKNDRTASFRGSVRILDLLGSTDKSLIVINKSNHIITLDYDRERVERDVREWMLKRI